MTKINLKHCIYNIDGEYVVNKMIKDGSSIYSSFSQIKKSNLEIAYGLNEKEIGNIPAFDGFTMLPENDPTLYKQSVNNGKELLNLNLYELPIHPRGGLLEDLKRENNWDTILDLILKIAPDEKPFPDSRFTYKQLMLDYLAIAWKRPTQRLPILIFDSNESNCYVELFFELIKSIFQKNATGFYKKDLSSGFNKEWGLSNFLLISENEISHKMMDWIKEESSSEIRKIISKDFQSFEIPNYSKIILASKEISNFPDNDNENLPFVVEPLPFPEEEDEGYYFYCFEIELPYFLDYLENYHKIISEKESSIWFNFTDIKTPVLRKLQERSKLLFYSKVEKTLNSLFRGSLLIYTEGIWEFSLSGFQKAMETENVKKADLKEVLKMFGVRSDAHKEKFICSISGKRMHAIPYYISNEELKEANYIQDLFPKLLCTEIECEA